MNSAPEAATSNINDSTGPEVAVETITEGQVAWFDQQLADGHHLGAGWSVGDYLRQVVKVRGRVAALLVWGPGLRRKLQEIAALK